MHATSDPATHPVLVAEDLDDDFDTVVEGARRAGVGNPLLRVRTLAEAARLLAAPDRPPLALVLSDVNLPDGAGRDLVAAVRADARLRLTPVVVFSTSGNARDLHELYAAGASAYHVKALRHRDNLEQLASIFRYWLQTVSLTDAASA